MSLESMPGSVWVLGFLSQYLVLHWAFYPNGCSWQSNKECAEDAKQHPNEISIVCTDV